jgi:hypothetical protein
MKTYQKISEARRVLGIPEQATLLEIKQSIESSSKNGTRILTGKTKINVIR